MKKNIVPFTFFVFLSFLANAQEMNFQVTINTPKLETTDPKVFEDLEKNLEDFLNSTKWTDKVYEPEERINGNIQINIKGENSATEFDAELQIQASRPIYGSNSETVLLVHSDKDFVFSYEQFQPIQYSENTFQDNLSSMMAYYIYVILGMDADSFAPFSGEEYFRTAQEIVNTIPTNLTGLYRGWRSQDGNRNRFWLVESVLNPRLRPYRQGMYDYHLRGLDLMHTDQETARLVMSQVLENLQVAEKSYPNAMIFQVFANSKANEIVEIFKVADSATKNTVKRAMTKIDAANAAKYRQIGR